MAAAAPKESGPLEKDAGSDMSTQFNEKKQHGHIDQEELQDSGVESTPIYVPDDHDEVIDPRLKDYPVPMVARTVHLHNDPTQVASFERVKRMHTLKLTNPLLGSPS